VLVENGYSGSQSAAPIFARVAKAALLEASQPFQEAAPPPDQQAGAQQPDPAPAAVTLDPDIPRDKAKVDFTLSGAGKCRLENEISAGTGSFSWPSKHHKLSGADFRPRHPGIDLAAPSGSAVWASDGGVVIFAGWTDVGYGNTVVIDHGNGYRTLYGHLSQVSIGCGANVDPGKLIGLAGTTGNSTGPHLHFEIRVAEGFINPVRLLPEP
jgi:murein DD-endopeptidase MepM/ murein hydrolase activator NlpD